MPSTRSWNLQIGPAVGHVTDTFLPMQAPVRELADPRQIMVRNRALNLGIGPIEPMGNRGPRNMTPPAQLAAASQFVGQYAARRKAISQQKMDAQQETMGGPAQSMARMPASFDEVAARVRSRFAARQPFGPTEAPVGSGVTPPAVAERPTGPSGLGWSADIENAGDPTLRTMGTADTGPTRRKSGRQVGGQLGFGF